MVRAWRAARPHDLGSLRRLADTLRRAGEMDCRSVQGWIDRMGGEPYHGVSHRTGERAWPVEPERLLTDDVSEPVRRLAALGLPAVPALVDGLRTAARVRNGKSALRTMAHSVDALARIRPVPTCAIPAVLESLAAASPKVRAHVLFELAGPLRPRATPLAIRALTDCLDVGQEDRVRITAAQALSRLEGDLPGQARDAALAGLTDPQRWVRHFCLMTLARLRGPDDVVRAALCALFRRDEAHRPEVVRALLGFDEGKALDLLADELRRRAPGEEGRERYGRCLRLLEELGSRALPIVSAVRHRGPVESACVGEVFRGELRGHARPRESPVTDPTADRLLLLAGPWPAVDSRTALLAWVDSMSGEGHEVAARVALAAVRRVAYLYDMAEDVRNRVEEVERWVVARGRSREDVPAQLASFGGPLVDVSAVSPDFPARPGIDPHGTAQREHTLWAAEAMVRAVESPGGSLKHVGRAVEYACLALAESMGPVFRPITGEAPWYEPDAVERIRQAIVGEVLPWAVESWDPVVDVRSLGPG
ncbi:HEAT repeat domain-containing protein [Streptomyces sp. cg40]|uniref:HEAT repeat domain-containing protein n=1 Tax=Streptomyces sp. cg40 TaxID=3419764 RepID=UPI003CFE3497